MRIFTSVFIVLFLTGSCIPTKVAPKIETHRLTEGTKFSKELPPYPMFVFNDPKEAFEFYDYINEKFQLNDKDVGFNVPKNLNGKTIYFTYYEVDRESGNTNLLPLLASRVYSEVTDLEVNNPGINYRKTGESWYIAITARDDDWKSALETEHPQHAEVIDYLENMRKEYLSTQNYQELRFRDK